MTIILVAEPVPLFQDEHGTFRVKGSRVTLENVIATYQQGLSAEEIVQEFTTLEVANVHLVLGYYLHHQAEVEAYLAQQEVKSAEIRRKIEADYTPKQRELIARLVALRDERK